MAEMGKREPIFLLIYAVVAIGLGSWWIYDGGLAVGIGWFVIAVGSVATWYVRGRPGQTPWWARSVRWADVRSLVRRSSRTHLPR